MKARRLSIVSALMALTMLVCFILSSCGGGDKKSKLSASEYLERIFEVTFADVDPEVKTVKAEIAYLPTPDTTGLGAGKTDITVYHGTAGESVVLVNGSYMEAPVDIEVYLGGTTAILSSDILGDKPIGATTAQLEALMNLYMPSEGGAAVSPSVSEFFSFFENNVEGIEKLLEKYLEIISSSAEKATENKVILEDGVIAVDLEFNCDGAKKMIKDVFDKAKKDDDLRDLFEALIAASGYNGDELSELLRVYDEFFSSGDTLDQLFSEMNECDISSDFSVKADALYNLKTMDMKLSVYGETFEIAFDMSDSDKVSLSLGFSTVDPATDEVMHQNITYTVSTEEKDGEATVSASVKTETPFGTNEAVIYTLAVAENGDFTLLSNLFAASVAVSGNISDSEGKQTVTISGVTYNGVTKTVDITVTTEQDVELPEFPVDYKSVMSLTTEDIKGIVNTAKAHPLLQTLVGFMQGVAAPDTEYAE